MPKPSTCPTLYDETLQLNITKLKEWGYLDNNQFRSGKLTWSMNGYKTGSVSILVNTSYENPYIELEYRYRDEPIKYIVHLISVPSNLGIGKMWCKQ